MPDNDHNLGENVFAIIMDEHNFDCDGPDCQKVVLVGGVSCICSERELPGLAMVPTVPRGPGRGPGRSRR